MDEITRRVSAYILHDPVGNVEGYISEYDAAKLQDAEDAGMILLAEYSDLSRERVKASDVVEPQPEINGVTLVQPVYVDTRMSAVVDVFDALAQEGATKNVRMVSSEAALSFADALARLKEMIADDNA